MIAVILSKVSEICSAELLEELHVAGTRGVHLIKRLRHHSYSIMEGFGEYPVMKQVFSPWRLLSVSLMAAGIGWIIYLLVTTMEDRSRFAPDSAGWLVVATLLVAVSIGMTVTIFGLFLNANADQSYPARTIAQLHIAGQLLRYLPGRIWGLAFQISSTRGTIPAARLARANMDFMVFSTIGSASVGIALIVYQKSWPWWVATIPVLGGLMILGVLFFGGANRMLLLARRMLPARMARICEQLSMEQPSFLRLAAITAIFLASWLAYLAGWGMLGRVFHAFARADFIALCAYYTLASVIGIMSVVTPAGLGVREAAFVMLAANSADRETVAFFAVFGRVWLMIIEITMLLLITFLFSNKKGGCR